MTKSVLSALLLVLAGPVSAASLEDLKADFASPALRAGLAGIQQAAPLWNSVSMRVYNSQTFCSVNDPFLRISLNGSKSSDGHFFFNGNAAGKYLNLSAYPQSSQNPRQGYNVYGSGVNLWIYSSGNSFSVNGTVNGRSLWLQIYSYGPGHYSIYGQTGLNLNVSGSADSLWVNGSVDLSRFDESAVAVLGAVLSILNSLPPAAQ